MDFTTLLDLLDSSMRLAMPLLLACLAGLYSERAGIFDIGLEGKMLTAAFFSAAVAYHYSVHPLFSYETLQCDPGGANCQTVLHEVRAPIAPAWLGLLAGIASSMALSAIHGLASITFRGNQLISGVAINFLASGMTVLVAQNWFRQGGRTPSLEGTARFTPVDLPFADAIGDSVPILGPIYRELISGHTILVYLALACVPLTWWIFYRTRFGLRLRAVGENPESVDTAGVSVVGLRFAAVAIAGILCGIAGAYLATALQAGFVREMTSGRGYIALAALIFAKWRPWQALGATLLFGLLQAIAVRFQNIDLGGFVIPVQFMEALPYILTVVILAGFVGRAIPPRAGGEPYVKER
ncbi:MAG: ABC transporter permease [Paracoccaceae bacterium]|jgi:simple sugar transport system permease protein